MIHLHHNFAKKIIIICFSTWNGLNLGKKSLNNYKPQKAQKKTKEAQKKNCYSHFCFIIFLN
jgi:hypothetical protein